MLWKKESNQPNALYVDISNDDSMTLLTNMMTSVYLDFQRRNEEEIFLKCDDMALRMRKKGNEFFGRNDWPEAIEMYNKSLCFAEQRSSNISLAYANRSHCFLKMKMYKECLSDIELAKAAAYPQHLLPKLEARQTECSKQMKEEEEEHGATSMTQIDLKLSFEPNEQFPCLADVLQIDKDINGVYCVTAKEDIDVGKTIAVEKAFSTYLYSRFQWRCNICLKEMANLVPCKKCNVAMFCLDCHTNNYLHDYECGKRISNEIKENGDLMEDLRTIFMAVSAFPNADELMRFVERAIKNEPTSSSSSSPSSETLTDIQSKYREYLKLPMHPNHPHEYSQIICHAINIHNYILHIPKMAKMFETVKHRRFLKHLIIHHSLITTFNSRRTKINGDQLYYTQTGIMHQYFKHSCAPNAFMSEIDGHFACITIRPVKKGDQLSTSFYRFLLKPSNERQATFFYRTRTLCTCIRCVGVSASFNQRRQLRLDPDLQYIKSKFSTLNYIKFSVYPYHCDQETSSTIIRKCMQFLRNHGQIPWCDEIGLVVAIYMYLLRLWINPVDLMPLL